MIKKHRLVLTALVCGIVSQSAVLEAANWYVDTMAVGLRNGTSWPNAWTNFAGIVWGSSGVQPGDTLFISGGSTEKVYKEFLYMGASGTAGSRITISVGQETGHNGKVIFDGENKRKYGLQIGHYTTVTGKAGSNTNLVFRNFLVVTNTTRETDSGTPFYGGIANGAVLEYAEIYHANNGIFFSGAQNAEIRNCYLHDIWGDYGIRVSSYAGTNFSNYLIHHCVIRLNVDTVGSGGGPDGVQGQNGITLRDCSVVSVPGPVNPGQHPDGIQTGGSYIKVYNNYFANFLNSALKPNPVGQSQWVEYYAFNNIVACDDPVFQSSGHMVGAELGWSDPLNLVSNIIVLNNTFVDLPGMAVNGGAMNYQWPTVNFLVENNIIYNCGTMTRVAGDIRGTNVVFNNNLVSAGSLGAITLVRRDDAGATKTFVQADGRYGIPAFVSYAVRTKANNLHLDPSDTAAKGQGLSLPAYLRTDMDGYTRPVTGPWTLGVYEYRNGSTAAITAIPASQVFGTIATGTTADRDFTVQNTGSNAVSGAASVPAPFSIISGSPYSLGIGQSQVVTVRYAPTSAGTHVQSVTFTGGAGAVCSVTGMATNPPSPQPVIAVTPASQNFGSLTVGSSADRSFTVTNTGAGTLSGAASVPLPFSIISGTPYSLGSGQSQVVTVRYTPTAAGTHVQSVTFTGGAGAVCSATGVATNPPVPQPVIAVTPASQDFGSVMVGNSVDRQFTVTNAGAGTLSGTATVPAPFSVVSGSPYSVGVGQSQVVVVRYTPTTAGSANQSVVFTGGGGASRVVTGSASAILSGLSFEAEAGVVTSPFIVTNGYIYQTMLTGVTNGGRAAFAFTVSTAGTYTVTAVVDAPSDAANSLFVNIDAEPQDPYMVWDIPFTSGFETRTVSWRGNGTADQSEFVPKVFNLSQGQHQLIIRGREGGVRLDRIAVVIKARPKAPTNLRVASAP